LALHTLRAQLAGAAIRGVDERARIGRRYEYRRRIRPAIPISPSPSSDSVVGSGSTGTTVTV
jgi:hypothetical protein